MDNDLQYVKHDEPVADGAPRAGNANRWAASSNSLRLSSQRTKSRLSKIMGTPAYKSMTIRSWNTTTKLLEILRKMDADS
jgi:uncharacterized protein (DUF1697 family)